MIGHEDIPILRFAAKKALENGEITARQYELIMKRIDEVIEDKNDRFDVSIMNKVNNQLVQA